MKFKTLIFEKLDEFYISKIMGVSKILAKWYELNKRDLPWRHTSDPYKIWVSEIILQQTRVNQGMGYYRKFIETFPDINSLANSDINDVLRIWQGLGYYSRARNMHSAVNEIMQKHNGIFPEKFNEILNLKGIGTYTASAIASLVYNYPVAAVDGNVIRVISRLFALSGNKNSALFKNEIESKALSILNRKNPGQHNQAVIELGALLCTPVNPQCSLCPLISYCQAYTENIVHELPAKYPKKTSRNRYFYYYYIQWEDFFFITKRTKKDIWNSLYELPLFESSLPLNDQEIMKAITREWNLEPEKTIITSISDSKKHILSHQNIHTRFIIAKSALKPDIPEWIKIRKNEINNYPFPILITNFLGKVNL